MKSTPLDLIDEERKILHNFKEVFHTMSNELNWKTDFNEDINSEKLFKEEIKELKSTSLDYEYAVYLSQLYLIQKIKQRIKSARKFYLRYKDDPKLLIKEHSKYRMSFTKTFLKMIEWTPEKKLKNKAKWLDLLSEYNEWLFKLTFKLEKGE